MLVKDKGSAIAILRTLGASRGMIMRVFFIVGASIGVVGTLVGALRAPPPTTRLVGFVGTNFLGTDTEGSVMGPSFMVALDGSVAQWHRRIPRRSAKKSSSPKEQENFE